jgi:hemoglobin
LTPSAPIPENAARRAAIGREISARTGLDEPTVEKLLRAFYGTAKADPLLGPAFEGVDDWEDHIRRITRFWCSVALMTGDYHGQPLQAHRKLPIAPQHFARWLALFEKACREHLSPEGVDHMMDRARRIARSLEMGLFPLPLPAQSQKGVVA